MKALRMEHEVDPRVEIFNALGGKLDGISLVQPASVLLCMYERPEKLKSIKTDTGETVSLVITGKQREEDKYQGKAGLILALGSLAFKDDEDHKWGEERPKVGDWVMIRVGDTFPFMVDDRTMRIVHEKHVHLILPHPDMVY